MLFRISLTLLSLFLLPAIAVSESIAEKTSSMEKHEGFFTFYWDSAEGKICLEIPRMNSEFLYVTSLAAGVGSNDIGLDRGQLGGGRLVHFERSGPKVLLVQPNTAYRADTDNPEERRSVEDAFARSVLWGFTVAAETNGKVLVDATDFFLRDAHDVIGSLTRTDQGQYKLDQSRSAFFLPATKNFPLNTEVEVTLTFTGEASGQWVRQVVPTPEAITVRQHHSLVQLPEEGYSPRAFDPRSGLIWISYQDYATPITEPLVKRLITRHRLEKKDPGAVMSEPVKPIVYYLDRGTPEPVRSALLDGARWWNQAFEAAGYKDAFRVEMLPEGADPLDIRYNMIQWVHRATRGWSYGTFIDDPRTGEILKGHVSLGSLRVRQDFLIAEGLIADYQEGRATDPAMLEMALARIRQLSAHEVGHTLGLQHNYVASTVDRASVMDYPHPLVTAREDGSLDLSRAYASGIGEWDKVAIAYAYQDFPEGVDENAGLGKIILDAKSRGLIFLTDQDARPPGSSHPQTHLWDNGTNAVDELARIVEVRSIGLKNFSESKIRPGMPMATLEDVLVPLYMSHRYQAEAAVKVLGGLEYTYALRGDGQKPVVMVPPGEQRRALDALLAILGPEVLEVPENILALLPPRPAGYPATREHFRRNTEMTFDPLAVAEASAHHVLSLILDPARCARLDEYHSRDQQFPGPSEVFRKILESTWYADRQNGYHGAIQRSVDAVALHDLLMLGLDERTTAQVKGHVLNAVEDLKALLTGRIKSTKDEELRAHDRYGLSLIKSFEERPDEVRKSGPPDPPAGPPIGSFECDGEF